MIVHALVILGLFSLCNSRYEIVTNLSANAVKGIFNRSFQKTNCVHCTKIQRCNGNVSRRTAYYKGYKDTTIVDEIGTRKGLWYIQLVVYETIVDSHRNECLVRKLVYGVYILNHFCSVDRWVNPKALLCCELHVTGTLTLYISIPSPSAS